jgi:hypothetical protein
MAVWTGHSKSHLLNERTHMKNRQIREKGQKLGIEDAFRMNLTDVIYRIQKTEGNVPCFKTGNDGCN